MLARTAFRLIAFVLVTPALSGSISAQSFALAAHGQTVAPERPLLTMRALKAGNSPFPSLAFWSVMQ